MEIVKCGDRLFLMTRDRWLQMLRDFASGMTVMLDNYGRDIATLKADFDFSTITREEVQALLERLGHATQVQ